VGVLLLASDAWPKAFVDAVLDELGGDEGGSIVVGSGRTCLAALGMPVRRRALVVDDAPRDIAVGSLVEAARMIDPELPVLLVRYGWLGPPCEVDGVHIRPGPLVSQAGAEALKELLGTVMR